MTVHRSGCECDAYACRLRAKSIGISPAATPSRHNRVAPAAHTNNSWERGIAGEHRPDGSFMPILDRTGTPMPIKTYTEQRHKVDEQVRQARQPSTI